MHRLILILLLFISIPSFASCFRLEAESGGSTISSICIESSGATTLLQGQNIEYSFQATVLFIPAHDVYRQGLDEGHSYHIPAQNQYSGSTNRAELDATISLLPNPPGVNGGCSGHLEYDGVNYCFMPDNPASNFALAHMCSINADLPCHFWSSGGH